MSLRAHTQDRMKLKRKRRERFIEQPVPRSLEDAVEEMEEAGSLVGDLDAFEARVLGPSAGPWSTAT